jgi:hypothetical protein
LPGAAHLRVGLVSQGRTNQTDPRKTSRFAYFHAFTS